MTKAICGRQALCGLMVPGENSPPQQGGIAASMHASQSEKLREQISHPQQQARSRESKLDIGQGYRFIKLILGTYSPQ